MANVTVRMMACHTLTLWTPQQTRDRVHQAVRTAQINYHTNYDVIYCQQQSEGAMAANRETKALVTSPSRFVSAQLL